MHESMYKSIRQSIDLTGKAAIVTGGAMGIGLGIAVRLAEAGAHVVIADIDEQAGAAAAQQLRDRGWKSEFARTDVADAQQVEAAVGLALRTCGSVDILVNNAGIYPIIPVMQMALADFEKILAVNLESVFLFTRAVAEVMIGRGKGGRIINITSIDALHPSSVGLAVYDASKHGLWGFTKNTALELAPHGIQVNAIAPGAIATPGTGSGAPATPEMEQILSRFLAKIPMQRMGEPDDVGKAALFLASELSSYMTGSQIVVDGGVLLS
jgi:2-deoxy-D-gluconate 3-dehydrogenase